MATVKFRLKAKTDNSQIFLRFSISRNQVFETKTGLTVNFKDWSNEKSQIKQTKAENKITALQLNDLSNFIQREYNTDFSKGVIFSTNWLKKKIDLFFGRNSNPENDDLFWYTSIITLNCEKWIAVLKMLPFKNSSKCKQK